MTETTKDRLTFYLKQKGINKSDFGRRIGVSNAYVSSMRNSIQPDKLEKIASSFSDLNITWLMTGEGEMLNRATPASTPSEVIPLINIDSVGGVHSENSITLSEQHIIRQLAIDGARDGDVAILQSGTSMSPTIPSGSVLLIRQVPEWRDYFGYGSVYVLLLKDGRRITKEVRKFEPDPLNYVTCVSFNPDVADEELPRSLIVGVWKVVKALIDFGW